MLVRGFEGWHLVIIALLVTVLFGSRRMPDAARSIGQSLRIFKSEVKAGHQENAEAPAPASPAPAQAAAMQLPNVAAAQQRSAQDGLLSSDAAVQPIAQPVAHVAAPRP
jgi:sec-independent protein translocase protein TatA